MRKNFVCKLMALALVLVLAVSMAACGSGSDDAIVGTWELESIEQGGQTINIKDAFEQLGADVGYSMAMTFKADGSFKMEGNVLGQSVVEEGTWKKDGSGYSVEVDGESTEASISGGKLTFGDDDMKMTLVRK